jgi:para-nitrobenzyl esterase
MMQAGETLTEQPEVQISAGTLRGLMRNGIEAFLGVPYAAPPVGPLRYAAPVPSAAWPGIRACTQPGPTSPQTRPPTGAVDIDIDLLLGPKWQYAAGGGSDDYLTLNVLRPPGLRAGLPVMVWIHGGGFIYGSKDIAICDGTSFARDGVVFVAINYRLGAEGFLAIPGVPTNLGLRDQIAALHWVQANIAAFGGNPDNVTIFGESAGGVAVSCLLASPLAAGLFRRAIVQSGHGLLKRRPKDVQKVVRKMARYLRIKPDIDGFRTVSVIDTLAAQDRVGKAFIDLRDEDGVDPSFGLSRFMPVCGDDVLPESPDMLLRQGQSAAVDLLIGTTAEEMNMFLVPGGAGDKLNWLTATYLMHRALPKAWRALKAYGLGRRGITAGQALGRAATDLFFREPARRFAAAHRGPTHFWEFGWRSSAFGGALGAAHSVENPFIFDTLARSRDIVGDNPPQELADYIHGVWLNFATDGSAPWAPFSENARWVLALEKRSVSIEAPLLAAGLLP